MTYQPSHLQAKSIHLRVDQNLPQKPQGPPCIDQRPSWHCPACGVAYAKAGEIGMSVRRSTTTVDSGGGS